MPDRKFSFTEVISDDPEVISFDLEKQITKKRRIRGGANEHNALKRAELAAFQLIIKKLNDIEQQISRLEK